VEIGRIGELLLCQPGEYSRGAQMTTVMETIDLGSPSVVHCSSSHTATASVFGQ
jgi:hypothetical protein